MSSPTGLGHPIPHPCFQLISNRKGEKFWLLDRQHLNGRHPICLLTLNNVTEAFSIIILFIINGVFNDCVFFSVVFVIAFFWDIPLLLPVIFEPRPTESSGQATEQTSGKDSSKQYHSYIYHRPITVGLRFENSSRENILHPEWVTNTLSVAA